MMGECLIDERRDHMTGQGWQVYRDGGFLCDPRTRLVQWPTEHLGHCIEVRVPLHISADEFTRNQHGKVRAWTNNSVIEWKDRRFMSYRAECFPWWRNTKTGLVELDKDWNVIPGTDRWLTLPGRTGWVNAEDGRFLIHNGRLYLSYNCGVQQRLALLTDDGIAEAATVIDSADFQLQSREKNWSFFSHDGDLYAIYSAQPHRIVWVSKRAATRVAETNFPGIWGLGSIRGGASPVLHNGLWYHFFHSSHPMNLGEDHARWGNIRRYHVGLYTFEPVEPFRVTGCLKMPLVCGQRDPPPEDDWVKHWPSAHAVVFPGSATREEGGWMIAYGRNDRECWRAHVPDEVIEEGMQWY